MKPPKPRAGGEWTEARYWAFIRSALRQASRRWPPIARHAMQAARRSYTGPNTRQKWEHQCAICGGWWKATEVQVDHIEPCGNLRDDVAGFIDRLFCEADGLRVLCHACHRARKAA